jgi:hypothetical protein
MHASVTVERDSEWSGMHLKQGDEGMSKEEMLAKVTAAKKTHSANMQKALLLSKGIPLEGEQVPVSYKECAFGKWLYGDEETIRSALGNAEFDEIERLHQAWHEEYMKIFDLYYGNTKQGFLGKLIGMKPKLSEMDKERANAYSVDLKDVTWTLVKKLEGVEKRINKLPSDCC